MLVEYVEPVIYRSLSARVCNSLGMTFLLAVCTMAESLHLDISSRLNANGTAGTASSRHGAIKLMYCECS